MLTCPISNQCLKRQCISRRLSRGTVIFSPYEVIITTELDKITFSCQQLRNAHILFIITTKVPVHLGHSKPREIDPPSGTVSGTDVPYTAKDRM